jgi:hypothetical protein
MTLASLTPAGRAEAATDGGDEGQRLVAFHLQRLKAFLPSSLEGSANLRACNKTKRHDAHQISRTRRPNEQRDPQRIPAPIGKH